MSFFHFWPVIRLVSHFKLKISKCKLNGGQKKYGGNYLFFRSKDIYSKLNKSLKLRSIILTFRGLTEIKYAQKWNFSIILSHELQIFRINCRKKIMLVRKYFTLFSIQSGFHNLLQIKYLCLLELNYGC